MKHSLITLTAAAVFLTGFSGNAAAQPETMAFKYDANQSTEHTYKRLRRQARVACDIAYSPRAQKLCTNGYLQEVVSKIGKPSLIALHDSKMHKRKRTREFMVANIDNLKTRTP